MSETPELHEEWAVEHCQGIYTGSSYGRPLTRAEAEAWMADDISRDIRRQPHARGRQRLLRRVVSGWTAPSPAQHAAAEGEG